MAIVEAQAHGILAHRFDALDVDVRLAGLQHLLSGAMPAHFGGGGVDPQEFTGQLEAAAVVEAQLQHPRLAVQADFGGTWLGGLGGHGEASENIPA